MSETSEKVEEIVVVANPKKHAAEKFQKTHKKKRKQIESLEVGHHVLLTVYQSDNLPALFFPDAIPKGRDMEVIQILRTLNQEARLVFTATLEDLLLGDDETRYPYERNTLIYTQFMGHSFDRSMHGKWCFAADPKVFKNIRTT